MWHIAPASMNAFVFKHIFFYQTALQKLSKTKKKHSVNHKLYNLVQSTRECKCNEYTGIHMQTDFRPFYIITKLVNVRNRKR